MSVQLRRPDASDRSRLASSATGSAFAVAPIGSRVLTDAVSRYEANLPRIQVIGRHAQFNRQVTGSQCTLSFLDRSIALLRRLKTKISSKLAGDLVNQAQLDDMLANFTAQWSERYAATSGYLDDQLIFTGNPLARRYFYMQGFDLQSLQSGHPEMLTFYPHGLGRRSASVAIERQMTTDAIVRKLNHALAPVGVNATLNSDGALVFSVPEGDWLALRGQLLLRGGGIRFPDGRPNSIELQRLPGKIDPAQWDLANQSALRTTLRRIIDAQDQLRQTCETVQKVIDYALHQLNKRALERHDQDQHAQEIPKNFNTILERPSDYRLFSTLAPVLSGISRYRVLSSL